MAVKLLAVPASHPCAAVAAMLDAKGIEYERRDLLPALSRVWLRSTGFPAATVPALRIDGRRIQGSREIARALDARQPDPPLFPADAAARNLVEEVESWADGPLQSAARRIVLCALVRKPEAVRPALDGARLRIPLPGAVAAPLARPVLRLDAALNGATGEAVRADLAGLPAMLDQIDGWIAAGVLGADPPTAADYQVAGSVRMLLNLRDLDGILLARPAAELARRLIPSFPGLVPTGALPAAWIP